MLKNICISCGKAPISSRAKYCQTCFHISRRGVSSWNKGTKGLKRNFSEKTIEKYRVSLSGSNNPRWKGGHVNSGHGYVSIRRVKHPFNVNGYVLEHRIVMEEELGRYLDKKEIVHHKNGVRSDNRPENLIILTRKTHHGVVLCPFCNKEFEIK